MKRILLLITVICFAFGLQAQDITVRNSKVFNVKGGTADTLNLNDTDSYKIYVANYAKYLKVGVDIDSIAGDPAVQTIIRTSLNYVDWTDVDTISTTDSDPYEIGLLLQPYTQYIEIESKGITNAQTTRFKYNILIEKGD